ncbi:MAG: hypothetical protein U0X20_07390 [Caldilineaceae bacterium]
MRSISALLDARDEDWYDITLPTGLPVQFPTWFHAVPQPDGAWDAFAPDGTRIATMPLGASFFDQTCFPYVDGYPDNFDNLSQVMPFSCTGPAWHTVPGMLRVNPISGINCAPVPWRCCARTPTAPS